jgi:hypothetical protein
MRSVSFKNNVRFLFLTTMITSFSLFSPLLAATEEQAPSTVIEPSKEGSGKLSLQEELRKKFEKGKPDLKHVEPGSGVSQKAPPPPTVAPPVKTEEGTNKGVTYMDELKKRVQEGGGLKKTEIAPKVVEPKPEETLLQQQKGQLKPTITKEPMTPQQLYQEEQRLKKEAQEKQALQTASPSTQPPILTEDQKKAEAIKKQELIIQKEKELKAKFKSLIDEMQNLAKDSGMASSKRDMQDLRTQGLRIFDKLDEQAQSAKR